MGGMGLIFTPVLVRSLIGPPGLSRPMTNGSWTHSYSKQSNWVVQPAFGFPPAPTTPLTPTHPLKRAIRDITVVMKKVAQNPAVLAS